MAPGFIAIGSGPAGLAAAEVFRRRHPDIPVRIITTDPALPYAKPPLSKSDLCGRQATLDLHSPDWFVRHNVELLRGITVEHIDPGNREVVTAGGRHYPYWHLVLACGSTAVPLKVPGGEAALSLRSLADAVILRMVAVHAESAVVVGGGLIGCEAASSLATRGMLTTLVAPEPVPLLRRFGSEVGERVAKMLSDIGVRFIGSATGPRSRTLECSWTPVRRSGANSSCLPPGCAPTSARNGGGHDTENGRFVVDERMHTSAVNVYAAGDVALAYNVTAGRRIPAEHWRDAAQQGRIAGQSAAGYPAAWDAVPEFSCTIGESD